jgi:hypothetical protein
VGGAHARQHTFLSISYHFGRAKVCDLYMHLIIQEDILWLQVSAGEDELTPP